MILEGNSVIHSNATPGRGEPLGSTDTSFFAALKLLFTHFEMTWRRCLRIAGHALF